MPHLIYQGLRRDTIRLSTEGVCISRARANVEATSPWPDFCPWRRKCRNVPRIWGGTKFRSDCTTKSSKSMPSCLGSVERRSFFASRVIDLFCTISRDAFHRINVPSCILSCAVLHEWRRESILRSLRTDYCSCHLNIRPIALYTKHGIDATGSDAPRTTELGKLVFLQQYAARTFLLTLLSKVVG